MNTETKSIETLQKEYHEHVKALEQQMAVMKALSEQIKEAKRSAPITPHFSDKGLIVLPNFFKRGKQRDLMFYPGQWEKLFKPEQVKLVQELIEQSKQLKVQQDEEESA
jgi:hypothetical protein